MGNAWRHLANEFRNQQVRILLTGLGPSGKTTTLYMLKQGEVVTAIPPTLGFNVETIKYQRIDFVIWDVSRKSEIRVSWRHYYMDKEAVVYVIDSNDRERISECKDDLWCLLREDELRNCAFLVLANKQDLPGAMSTEEVREKLELDSEELGDKRIYVQGASATKGEGLYEGLDWLASALHKQKTRRDKT